MKGWKITQKTLQVSPGCSLEPHFRCAACHSTLICKGLWIIDPGVVILAPMYSTPYAARVEWPSRYAGLSARYSSKPSTPSTIDLPGQVFAGAASRETVYHKLRPRYKIYACTSRFQSSLSPRFFVITILSRSGSIFSAPIYACMPAPFRRWACKSSVNRRSKVVKTIFFAFFS